MRRRHVMTSPARRRPRPSFAALTRSRSSLSRALGPRAPSRVPQQIVAGPEDQLLPSANADYLIWTANSGASPEPLPRVREAPRDERVFRLNPPAPAATRAASIPDRTWRSTSRSTGRASDLYHDRPRDAGRHQLPAPINSGRWEWGPRVSNAFYLFARDAAAKTTLFLYDRAAKSIERLASYDLTTVLRRAPGAVGERYATWTVCGPLTLQRLRPGHRDRPDAEDPRPRREGSVRAGRRRGREPRLLRPVGARVRCRGPHHAASPLSDLAATPVGLRTLPAGVDVGGQLSARGRPSRVDLWFSRYRCGPQQGDIYRLRDVGDASEPHPRRSGLVRQVGSAVSLPRDLVAGVGPNVDAGGLHPSPGLRVALERQRDRVARAPGRWDPSSRTRRPGTSTICMSRVPEQLDEANGEMRRARPRRGPRRASTGTRAGGCTAAGPARWGRSNETTVTSGRGARRASTPAVVVR